MPGEGELLRGKAWGKGRFLSEKESLSRSLDLWGEESVSAA